MKAAVNYSKCPQRQINNIFHCQSRTEGVKLTLKKYHDGEFVRFYVILYLAYDHLLILQYSSESSRSNIVDLSYAILSSIEKQSCSLQNYRIRS